jgi:hypothetical protein
VGAILLVQKVVERRSKPREKPADPQVTAEEFILERLQKLSLDLSAEQIEEVQQALQERYNLSAADAEETLTGVIRSEAFERITGARCTCYAESKQYGKYFHAPSCEYRKFLEEK